ncbi:MULTISPECIES: caspase domain-containing protein [Rhodomicrobium]|uniref:caspase family protein n=1 Tax=Rhodomicrobium TaxID=1068 RepID=UPI001482BE54|nr:MULTISPECIES: caspase domain-containing protein [Rhodomicrobium]
MFQAISRLALVLLALAAGNAASVALASEGRVALVIGNAAYRNASVLDNPRNDAVDMAAAAEKLGFKVIRGLDLDKSGMDRTIRQFAEALRGASVGMFFYAGHGLQVGGKNYLVPVDAELKTAESLDFEMVGLDVVQRVMEAATETNLLFVDACRDNPLSRNLARAMGTRSAAIGSGLTAQEAGAGTLISFSTQPGNVALDGVRSRNSPYAGALVKHITAQGKDLPAVLVQVRREVMAATGKRQIPWEHSALTAEIMLAPQATGETAPADPDPSPGPEPKTALNAAPGPESASPAPQQRVVKAGGFTGTLKIVNNKSNEYLFNENGRKILVSDSNPSGVIPAGVALELPQGRYHIKGNSGLITVKPLEIKKGETVIVDFHKHVGSLRLINNKDEQYLFTDSEKRLWIEQEAGGKFTMGAVPRDIPIELPPGRYRLTSGNPLTAVEPFEIKAGEETVIDFGG